MSYNSDDLIITQLPAEIFSKNICYTNAILNGT